MFLCTALQLVPITVLLYYMFLCTALQHVPITVLHLGFSPIFLDLQGFSIIFRLSNRQDRFAPNELSSEPGELACYPPWLPSATQFVR